MELKTNYQFTYFIYPFAVKEENYKKYISGILKNKNYQIKFFDSFKDIELYKYFTPSVKEKIFQDFTFNKEKINKFYKLSLGQRIKILEKQNCLIFEYILEDQMQGKIEEKDGIFFNISKIELICFNTGICFLTFKTLLQETNDFKDVLNFNYKFENINLENKNIKRLDNIKIQTNAFNNMNRISEIIQDITGKKIENRNIDMEENAFLVYTYVCLESGVWNKENDFENIENEFIKLAEVKPHDVNINVDYDKLSLLANSSYLKMRINNKCVAAICSTADIENYTKFPELYEEQYLYTYIIALHQKYYLKKLNLEMKIKPQLAIKKFINFTNNIWINEITTDSFGQKIYKRCKEKLNLEEIFFEVKNKYDIFYKKLNIEKNKKTNTIFIILLILSLIIGGANLLSWIFFK